MASNTLRCCALAKWASHTNGQLLCTILNPHIIRIYKALARSSRQRMTLLPSSSPRSVSGFEWPKSLELNAPLKSSGKTVNIWIGFWAGHGRGIIESDSQRPSLTFSLSPLSSALPLTHSLQRSPFGTLFRFRQMALCASVNLHLVIEMSGARQTERPAEAKDQNETDKGNQKRKGIQVHEVTKLGYPLKEVVAKV